MTKRADSTEQHFTAQLVKPRGDTLGWTVAMLPFAPKNVWPRMVRLRVRGTICSSGRRRAEVEFRSSLFPFEGGYFFLVNRTMQQAAHVTLGDTAEFTLEPDFDERAAELPDELAVLLDEEHGLRAYYDALSENMRREFGKWIYGVKSGEARMRRASQAAERMLFAMEGERELPVIEAAFRRRPRARAGWSRMTQNQRRSELMALAYYQSPEAQAKRLDKLCELAESRA